jgi:phosphomannomutase
VLFEMAASSRRMSEVFGALPHRFSRAALLRRFPRAASLKIVAALTGSTGEIPEFFTPDLGFGAVVRVDYTDGVRICFSNGDVAHVRPSGNADELRIYAVADTQARADEITGLGVAEPHGILRQLERAFA